MKISDLYKSSFFHRYINSLFGVSYDSKGEQSLTVVLVISSFLLTIASGYTTIVGLYEYVPKLIGFILGLGIQGLLFATAWRIGVSIVTQSMKFSLLLIFLFTMLASVFFSYTALLDVIYKPEYREKDEISNSVNSFSQIINEAQSEINKYYQGYTDTVLFEINNWNDSIVKTYSSAMNDELTTLNKRSAKYAEIENRFKNEVDYGITEKDGNGSYTPPGLGFYAKKYKKEMDNFYFDSLQIIKIQVRLADSLFKDYSNAIIDLTSSPNSLTTHNYIISKSKLNSLLSYLKKNFGNHISFTNLSSKGESYLNELSEVNGYRDWLIKNPLTSIPLNKDSLRVYGLSLASLIPPKFDNLSQEITKQAMRIGKYGGNDVHHFVLAYSSLVDTKSPLAYSALALALLIDSLILISGLLGARPDSFLNMRPEELFDSQERALEVILALNLEQTDNYDNQFIKRIIQIFNITKPDIAAAKMGTPGIIHKDDIERYNLTKEIGVFISLKLAATNKSNQDIIGLSTRLVIWLAEQVILYENKQGTYKDFQKILDDL